MCLKGSVGTNIGFSSIQNNVGTIALPEALRVCGSAPINMTASISATTMTVSAILSGSGNLFVGQPITGPGVAPYTKITAFLTGTGRTGTYSVNTSQTVASTTLEAASIANLPVAEAVFEVQIKTTSSAGKCGLLALQIYG